MTVILGISAYYHDSAAALVEDGRIVAAAQEERFTRVKGDPSYPEHAIGYCLAEGGVHERDLDHVVFYEDPVAKFDRLVTTYHTVPRSLRSYLRAMPDWLTHKLWLRHEIRKDLGIKAPIDVCDHHISHAASAFYPSPFDEAAILTVDGVGEWSTATWGIGRGHTIKLVEHLRFPNSLGLLFSAFTQFAGFRINSGEYKLMGLAPFGEPRFVDLIQRELAHVADDGSVTLNQRYFDYAGGLRMTNGAFDELFGGPPRVPEAEITQREMDLAASVQVVLNDAILKMARHVHGRTKLSSIVLAGGVALNVVSVGELAGCGPFGRVWTQPAAGDAGGALGAALWLWHQRLGNPRSAQQEDSMQGAFLGPAIHPRSASDDELLHRMGARWQELDEQALVESAGDAVAAGKVVGVARGRMEYGPRALGNRSIIADARDPQMRSRLNRKTKFREGFRPFAPIVLAEDASDWFDMRQTTSPYMLLVCDVRADARLPATDEASLIGFDRLNVCRSTIPAVTHVDLSARVQTCDPVRHPFMHATLLRFKQLTGCGVMINTSFNVRGEPIVNGAEDAFRCFMATDIDHLILGDRWLSKREQDGQAFDDDARRRWLERFPPD